MGNWLPKLDEQLQAWQEELVSEVKLSATEERSVASRVALEVSNLPSAAKRSIIESDSIPLSARLEELQAFQAFMDWASSVRGAPYLTRAQVVVQNYICFAYLKGSCFEVLRDNLPASSVTSRCCEFLVSGRMRGFRNAVAHSNWQYSQDFSGIRLLYRKERRMEESVVRQEELNFWQALARATAYAAFERL